MSSHEVAWILVCVTLLVLLLIASLVVAIAIAYRRQERQKASLIRTHLDYEQELRKIEGEVQESTMAYVSAELHDNIGQLLSVLRIQLGTYSVQKPELEPFMNPIGERVDEIVGQLRLLSHSLNTDFITDGGFEHMIASEVQRLRTAWGKPISYYTDQVELSLNKDQSIVAFRIFQEMISNILRHAKANCIEIVLHGTKGFLLEVNDDGCGFDTENALHGQTGQGLKSMHKRAQIAGLTLSIQSIPGKGSSFTLQSQAGAAIAPELPEDPRSVPAGG